MIVIVVSGLFFVMGWGIFHIINDVKELKHIVNDIKELKDGLYSGRDKNA